MRKCLSTATSAAVTFPGSGLNLFAFHKALIR